MTFIYPAVFTERADGSFEGYFPDLAGIEVEGRSLEFAVDEARDAMEAWLTAEFEEEEPELPPISDADEIRLQPGQRICDIAVHYRFHTGWDE